MCLQLPALAGSIGGDRGDRTDPPPRQAQKTEDSVAGGMCRVAKVAADPRLRLRGGSTCECVHGSAGVFAESSAPTPSQSSRISADILHLRKEALFWNRKMTWRRYTRADLLRRSRSNRIVERGEQAWPIGKNMQSGLQEGCDFL